MDFPRLLNKDFWTLLISIIFSLILFFNSNSESTIRVQSNVSDMIAFITYPQEWYQDIFLIQNENKLLADSLFHFKKDYYDLLLEVEEMKDSSGTFKKMVETGLFISERIDGELCTTVVITKFKEPRTFREMLELGVLIKQLKKPQQWSLVPARVTNKNSASIETILINVGKKDSIPIKQNLVVLDVSGGLLGKTIAVGNNASKVQLITDNNFSVSVRVGSGINSSLGNFVPTVGKYGILEGILKSTELNPGDLAYTSGISDIYPADIPVAKIISANKDNNKPFQDVKVEILSNFNNLNYVFIIL